MKLSLPEAGTVFAGAHDRRVAAGRHAGDAGRRPAARRGGRRGSRPSPRCATPSRAPAACGCPRARCAALASLLGRPAQARRRRRRRARPPQRDAPPRPHGDDRDRADDRRGARDRRHRRGHGPAGHDPRLARATASPPTHVVTGADGWSPIDPAVARRRSRDAGMRRHDVRQDRALAFGEKEIVNARSRRRLAASTGWQGDDAVAAGARAPTARSSTRAGRRSTASRSATRSRSPRRRATKLDLTVRGIEHSPVIDALGPRPDHDRPRRPTTARSRTSAAFSRSPPAATRRAALGGFPDAKVADHGGFVDEQLATWTRSWPSSTCCWRWP